MPVSSADIVFFPGVRISDAADGGGPPRYWPLPSGVPHNLFDAITPAQRAAGHLSVRKALPALHNNDTDVISAAAAYVAAAPNEAGVHGLLFASGGQAATRAAAAQFAATIDPLQPTNAGPWMATRSGPIEVQGRLDIASTGDPNIQEGDFLLFLENGFYRTAGYVSAVLFSGFGPPYWRTTVEIIGPDASGLRTLYYRPTEALRVEPCIDGEARPVGVALLSAAVGGGETVLPVAAVALPIPGAQTEATYSGIGSPQFAALGGRVPIFRRTGQVLIDDGAQSEVATVLRVGFDGRLHLTAGLANAHAAGTPVRGLLPLVVPAASAAVLHSLRTWARAFSSAPTGPLVAALYDDAAHPITVTNRGAITQQWACVFGASAGTFALIGSTVGQIATGNTGSDFSPINPATGVPYFTLPAAGWQGSPQVSNALRFDTTAAIAETSLWAVRTVPAGSAAGAADSMTVGVRSASVTGSVVLPWADGTALGGAGTAPPPPPNIGGQPAVMPVLSPGGAIPALPAYRTVHTVVVTDDDTAEVLPVEALTIAIDDGSMCWTLSASGAPALYELFAASLTPRVVRVWLDGIEWLFIVEGVSRSRGGAAEVSVQFTGRSAAMICGEPYSLPQNWINEGAATAAQLCIFAQEATGTVVQWFLEDWLVPDKVWTFAGSPLAVVQRVAESVGASVVCDRVANLLYVMPRYARLPAEWPAATPDVTIALAAARSDASERADRPAYNAVYVSGQQQGAIGKVVLAGTAGDAQAPLVTDLLITELAAVRQRGLAELGAGGKQIRERLVLPVLTGAGQPGVLSPGQLVRVDAPTPWSGVVRAVSVSWALPVLEQTVVVERHL